MPVCWWLVLNTKATKNDGPNRAGKNMSQEPKSSVNEGQGQRMEGEHSLQRSQRTFWSKKKTAMRRRVAWFTSSP